MKLAPFVAGIALCVYGGRECAAGARAGSAPVELTCAELSAMSRPPAGRVRVSDAFPVARGAVQETIGDRVATVHFPIVGTDTALYADACAIVDDVYAGVLSEAQAAREYEAAEASWSLAGVTLMLRSEEPSRFDDMAYDTTYAIEGVCTPALEALDADVRDFLAREAPDLDLGRVYVIDESGAPKPRAVAFGILALGAVLALVGGAGLFK